MGKMKIGIYCYPIAGILAKHFQKCLLNGAPPNKNFSPNPIILLVVMATERLNLLKMVLKINSSEAISAIQPLWIKLKLFRNAHNISLYKKHCFVVVAFLLLLLLLLLFFFFVVFCCCFLLLFCFVFRLFVLFFCFCFFFFCFFVCFFFCFFFFFFFFFLCCFVLFVFFFFFCFCFFVVVVF